jgi:hypothetical protein
MDTLPNDAGHGQDDDDVASEVRVTPRIYKDDPFGVYEVLIGISPKKRNVVARELMTLGLVFLRQKHGPSDSRAVPLSMGHMASASTLGATPVRKSAKRRATPVVATAEAARDAKDGAAAFTSLFGGALDAMAGTEVATG